MSKQFEVVSNIALAADAAGGGGHPGAGLVEDKLMWTLVRPESAGAAEFQRYVLEELAVAAGGLVPDATSVRVTLQEPSAFSGAIVNVGGDDRRVDAVLQITSSSSYVATDPVNSELGGELRPRPWVARPRDDHVRFESGRAARGADPVQADAVDQSARRELRPVAATRGARILVSSAVNGLDPALGWPRRSESPRAQPSKWAFKLLSVFSMLSWIHTTRPAWCASGIASSASYASRMRHVSSTMVPSDVGTKV